MGMASVVTQIQNTTPNGDDNVYPLLRSCFPYLVYNMQLSAGFYCNLCRSVYMCVYASALTYCSCRQCFVKNEQTGLNGAWKKANKNPEINLITPISRWHRFKHLKLCSQRKWNISILIELKVCTKCNRAIQSKSWSFFLSRLCMCASYVRYLSSDYFAKRSKP